MICNAGIYGTDWTPAQDQAYGRNLQRLKGSKKRGCVFRTDVTEYRRIVSSRAELGEIGELNISLSGFPLKTFYEDKFSRI